MARIPQPGREFPNLPSIDRSARFHPLFEDAYHWLLSTSWTRVLASMSLAFVCTNAVFAVLYRLGGDCINGARPGSWEDAIFFSVQTMATVGYGVLSPATDYASWIASAEAGLGLVGFAMATALMFSKFSRPTARVLFSAKMVVHNRDGVPHLSFRMANARANAVVQAKVHLVLLQREQTAEGHEIRKLHDIELLRDESPAFALTWVVFHRIDESSPFFGLDPPAFAASNAFFICSLTGVDDTFSATIAARYRYAAEDVVWNAQFDDVLQEVEDGKLVIDLMKLSSTHQTDVATS